MTRILITGSRDWTDADTISRSLEGFAEYGFSTEEDDIVLVHGAARGADTIAAGIAKNWGWIVEAHPAHDHPDPKARNLHMVNLGADVCLTFATSWASGTGHCARAARRSEILTLDFGVSTKPEDQP